MKNIHALIPVDAVGQTQHDRLFKLRIYILAAILHTDQQSGKGALRPVKIVQKYSQGIGGEQTCGTVNALGRVFQLRINDDHAERGGKADQQKIWQEKLEQRREQPHTLPQKNTAAAAEGNPIRCAEGHVDRSCDIHGCHKIGGDGGGTIGIDHPILHVVGNGKGNDRGAADIQQNTVQHIHAPVCPADKIFAGCVEQPHISLQHQCNQIDLADDPGQERGKTGVGCKIDSEDGADVHDQAEKAGI